MDTADDLFLEEEVVNTDAAEFMARNGDQYDYTTDFITDDIEEIDGYRPLPNEDESMRNTVAWRQHAVEEYVRLHGLTVTRISHAQCWPDVTFTGPLDAVVAFHREMAGLDHLDAEAVREAVAAQR